MARHGADWWAKRLEELEQGGNAERIARRHGVRLKTLMWWRTELRRRGHVGAAPRLLPVTVSSAPASAQPDDPLEVFVEIGPSRMTLRGSVSPEHLAAVVAALTRSC